MHFSDEKWRHINHRIKKMRGIQKYQTCSLLDERTPVSSHIDGQGCRSWELDPFAFLLTKHICGNFKGQAKKKIWTALPGKQSARSWSPIRIRFLLMAKTTLWDPRNMISICVGQIRNSLHLHSSSDIESPSYAEKLFEQKPSGDFIYSNYSHFLQYFMLCNVNFRALCSGSLSGPVCLAVCQLTSALCVDTVSYGFLIAKNLHEHTLRLVLVFHFI